MEEVSASGLEGAQEIIKRWEPFNRGESPIAYLEQLYPAMLWMLVEVRDEGKGEKYVVSIPAYACKEDLKQAVEDGMLILMSLKVIHFQSIFLIYFYLKRLIYV